MKDLWLVCYGILKDNILEKIQNFTIKKTLLKIKNYLKSLLKNVLKEEKKIKIKFD